MFCTRFLFFTPKPHLSSAIFDLEPACSLIWFFFPACFRCSSREEPLLDPQRQLNIQESPAVIFSSTETDSQDGGEDHQSLVSPGCSMDENKIRLHLTCFLVFQNSWWTGRCVPEKNPRISELTTFRTPVTWPRVYFLLHRNWDEKIIGVLFHQDIVQMTMKTLDFTSLDVFLL